MRLVILSIIVIGILSACSDPENINNKKSDLEQGAPNVILMIGDGMGLSQVSSLFYFKKDKIHMERFPTIGLVKTSSTYKITDSAASGTAMACGEKTYNGAIGVSTDTLAVENLVEVLSKRNYQTGLISTSSITHATPASFFAHVKSRNEAYQIAAQLHTSEVDFFAGGGIKYFKNRTDGNYLDSLGQRGFEMDTTSLKNKSDLKQNQKYGFLLGQDGLPKMIEGRGSFLPNATDLALNYFSSNDSPFFMMVEGSQIDWGGHANNTEYLVGEMIDFDEAVGVALDFAENDGNTIVIVTADHETGGFTLAAGQTEKGYSDYNQIAPSFSTGGHSATLVPLFTYGPESEKFSGVYENTNIFELIDQMTSEDKE